MFASTPNTIFRNAGIDSPFLTRVEPLGWGVSSALLAVPLTFDVVPASWRVVGLGVVGVGVRVFCLERLEVEAVIPGLEV